jgi:hypothetical protein
MSLLMVVLIWMVGCSEKKRAELRSEARAFVSKDPEPIIAGGSGSPAKRQAMSKWNPGSAPLQNAAKPEQIARPEPEYNTETYDRIVDNSFQAAATSPLSTLLSMSTPHR